jgi:ABC-type transport system involved in multi-copper enzyme maturation permease subunit
MLALVLLAVLLHGFGLPAENVDSTSEQLTLVVGWGEKLAAVFAGLLGAMSITSEIRHGTIRPTFLVTPRRTRVLAAKVLGSMFFGAAFGLIATALAVGVGSAALRARGIESQLDGGAYALFLVGGAAAAALWAAIGVGLGAVVRNQVPALIGICAWLLFVEGLLVGDLIGATGDVGRFAPGAAAAAISGQDPDKLVAPAVGLVLLVLYAAAAALAGSLATARRDVA